MSLKLMYITNRPDIALIAEKNGVERIFVDMEFIGKSLRQRGIDSVQNHHTIEDVRAVRAVLHRAELLVRYIRRQVEPPLYYYRDRDDLEIDAVIEAGADIVMLPYFKTAEEVRRFLSAVNGRAKTMLLLETKEAMEHFDEIMQLPGIDEVHIGLNDLSISLGKTYLFEPLADGTVEMLCTRLRGYGIPYGFGGVASLGRGMVPAEMIIKEHYLLGSHGAILSRSFCNVDKISEIGAIEEVFFRGIREIRMLEQECKYHIKYFMDNERDLKEAIRQVTERIKEQET